MRTGIAYRRLGCIVVAAGLATTLAACSSGGGGDASTKGIPAGPIKLGAVLTLSGPSAAYGESEENDLKVEVNILNKAGGIAGHQIQLDAKNDQGDPTVAAQVALQLVSDKVAGVVFPGIPGSEEQTVPIFNKYKIPVVGPDYSDLAKGQKYQYLFSTIPDNPSQMSVAAQYAKTKGYKKIAILTDGSSFGNTLTADFKTAAAARGLTITTTVTFPSTAVDLSTQVARAKATNPDALAVWANQGYNQVWSGMRAAGWNPPIITTEIPKLYTLKEMGSYANTAITPCYTPLVTGTQKPDSAITTYLKGVKAIAGAGAAADLPHASDYAIPIAAMKTAIEQAKSLDPSAIVSALESWNNKDVWSAATPLTFSATNHLGRPASANYMCGSAKQGAMGLDLGIAGTNASGA